MTTTATPTINIEPWMGDAIDELSARYAPSAESDFSGARLFLRWNLKGRDDGWQSVCLHAPTEAEAANTPAYAGRHWMGFALQGRDNGRGSPAWELDIDLGATDGGDGVLRMMTYLVSSPMEPFAETLHAASHRVASARQWEEFRDTILDGRMAELVRRIDAEADFADSAESTEEEEEADVEYEA